jgi:hypothetical protein
MTDAEIVQALNGLPDDAFYIASLWGFGVSAPQFQGGAVLVAENERQRAAFEALRDAGLAYFRSLDGNVGIAATDNGVRAYRMIKGSEAPPKS